MSECHETLYTCPSEDCENHRVDFDSVINYCSACGKKLIYIEISVEEEEQEL